MIKLSFIGKYVMVYICIYIDIDAVTMSVLHNELLSIKSLG